MLPKISISKMYQLPSFLQYITIEIQYSNKFLQSWMAWINKGTLCHTNSQPHPAKATLIHSHHKP